MTLSLDMYSQMDVANIIVRSHPCSKLPDKNYTLPDYLSKRSSTPIYSNSSESARAKVRKPWFPFSCAADHSFSEFVTTQRLSNMAIDDMLNRMTTEWYESTRISFKSHRDMKKVLDIGECLSHDSQVSSKFSRVFIK